MKRRYLYVMDPLESINPYTDSTFYLMLEAKNRDIENLVCHLNDLVISDGKGFAHVTSVDVFIPAFDGAPYYQTKHRETVSFDDCNVIWMRKDPPFDENYLTATFLLDCHNPSYTKVMNHPMGLRAANEKLWGLAKIPHLMPRTVVSANPQVLHESAQHFGKAVLKPLFNSGGAGVMVFDRHDKNLHSAIDLLTHEGKRQALVQEYLQGARHGDKRLILLGGKPVGAFTRVPQEDDHRANLHIGGQAKKARITLQDEQLAEALSPHLLQLGLHFVGLDIIEGKITEINVTSPTGLQEIDRFDGRAGKERLNSQILDYVEQI